MTDEEKLTAGLLILPDGYGDYHNADLCRGCGACCMHLTVPPFGEDEHDIEFEILPDDIKAELQAVYDRTFTEEGRFQPGVKTGPCCWLDLDTKRCKHYEHRPLTCRSFEPGPNNWVCVEDREAIGLETP